jgi:hypothetical protein
MTAILTTARDPTVAKPPKTFQANLLTAAAIVVSCLAVPARAQSGNVDRWPAGPNVAKSGAFAVVQIATVNEAEFVAVWRNPVPDVTEKVTTRPRRGQTLATFITFKGCKADRAGNCNVTVTYEMHDPSGKLIGRPTLKVWGHRPRPRPELVWLSEQSLGLGFSKADPLGTYTIDATVTDHVAGITLYTRQVHTLLA